MNYKLFLLPFFIISTISVFGQLNPTDRNLDSSFQINDINSNPLDDLIISNPPIDYSLFSIEILNLTTNGLIQPNNTINFNGEDILEIEFDLKLIYAGPYNPNFVNNVVGSISLYNPNNHNNQTNPNYDNGVRSYYLYHKEVNLEFDGNVYSQTIHRKIFLKRHTIHSVGNTISFGFSSWVNNLTFKRITYNLVGGSNETYPPNVPNSASTNTFDLKYSENLPIVNDSIILPNIENGYVDIDLKISYNTQHGSNLKLGYYGNIVIKIDNFNDTHSILDYRSLSNFNGIESFKNLRINTSDITSNQARIVIILQFQTGSYYETLSDLKIVKSNPIQLNIIHDNLSIPSNTNISVLNQNRPYIDKTQQCPWRGDCGYPIILEQINNFIWQYKVIGNEEWQNFLNQTEKDLNNATPLNQDILIRRIAIANNGFFNISNTISASIDDQIIENNICCNQTIPNLNTQPNLITGNVPAITNSFTYQWQYAVVPSATSTPSSWLNIANQNSKDYQHLYTDTNRRTSQYIKFRRLIIQNNIVKSTSNTILLTRNFSLSRSSDSENGKKINDLDKLNSNYLEIYPNPIINDLNIELPDANFKSFIILNQLGIIVKKGEITNTNYVKIDLSTISSGIYILILEDKSSNKIKKKIIKK